MSADATPANRSARVDPGGEPAIRMEATATGGDVFQAARDQHIHYGDGTRRVADGQSGDVCPYPGLAPFAPDQAQWFFGRDREIAQLVERLDERLRVGGPLLVIGPSGTGKSSLLRAGLLPALDRGALPAAGSARWPRAVFTPTAHPVAALGRAIASLGPDGADNTDGHASWGRDRDDDIAALRRALAAGPGEDTRAVLVVDQFEEAFTLCVDEDERRRLIDALFHLAGGAAENDDSDGAHGPALVVISLRADFYGHCLDHPWLRATVANHPLALGPMSQADLRAAIVYPAQDVGLDVEPGLAEVVLRDLGGDDGRMADGPSEAHAPAGAAARLPLLGHALRVTWQQRHGNTLTVAAYRATGGIPLAVATTAERVFTRLDPTARKTARGVFLRLVRVGDSGAEDTRRRLSRTELAAQMPDPAAAAAVLDAFTHSRLLVQEQDTVEIIHEALLRAWPRLRRWIDTDRAGNLRRQQIETAAAAWQRGNHDSGALLRGSRLETARTWLESSQREDRPSEVTARFIAASVQAERRAARLRRGAVASLAGLTALACVAAGFAVAFQRQANTQRDNAVLRQVQAEADGQRATDLGLASQLDLVAHQMRPTSQTYTALVSDASAVLSTPLPAQGSAITSVAFDPSGRTLATAGGALRTWNVADPARPAALSPSLSGTLAAVAFSPNGRVLARGGGDGTIRTLSMADPAHPAPLTAPVHAHTGAVNSVAWRHDGRVLATAAGGASPDSDLRLWDMSDPARPTPLGVAHAEPSAIGTPIAFSSDGRLLASGGPVVQLWDVSDPAHPERLGAPLPGAGPANSLALSPDGHVLASGGPDNLVRLWSLADPSHPQALGDPLAGHAGTVNTLAFDPGGRLLASGANDGTVRLWNLADPAHPTPLGRPLSGHTSAVSSVAFSPGGLLASASADGVARLWTIPPALRAEHVGGVNSVAYDNSGHLMASAGSVDGVKLWDTADSLRPLARSQPLADPAAGANSVALRGDGRVLAAGCADGTVRLWNTADPAHPTVFGAALAAPNGVLSVAFSRDGRVLATGGGRPNTALGFVRLWNVADPAHPTPFGDTLTHGNVVISVAFSPDGRTLASASADGTIGLWNLADPAHLTAAAPRRLTVGQLTLPLGVSFSPDGRTLASGDSAGTVRLWNVADPARPTLIGQPLTGHGNVVVSVAFSPDGRTLASGGADTTVRLWNTADLAHPTPIGQPLTGHPSRVYALAFTPDGGALASGDTDGMVQVAPLAASTAIQRVCAATGATLTEQLWRQYLPADIPYQPPCR